eukprot:TRINITY_DN59_c0_g3_i1.p1 TRINITY_DN59_c0_g3~~TRINITY_DN59_c0_g3_i1.p1  ORF type:complete len:228 (-),score=24.04 TRINITY_DN59_c0_g3_i1:24-707(-)
MLSKRHQAPEHQCQHCETYYTTKTSHKKRPPACEQCHHYSNVKEHWIGGKHCCSLKCEELESCPTGFRSAHASAQCYQNKILRDASQLRANENLSSFLEKNKSLRTDAMINKVPAYPTNFLSCLRDLPHLINLREERLNLIAEMQEEVEALSILINSSPAPRKKVTKTIAPPNVSLEENELPDLIVPNVSFENDDLIVVGSTDKFGSTQEKQQENPKKNVLGLITFV